MKKRFVALLLLAVVACFAFSQELQVTEYVLSSEKLKQDAVLAVVSDLHNTVFGENQAELAAAIQAAQPDAVLMLGDMAGDLNSLSGTRMLVEALGGEYPVFYVSGNHERMSGQLDQIKAELRGMGVRVLAGDAEMLPCGIRIAGVDNPDQQHWEEWLAQGNACRAGDEVFNVLLSHRPDLLRYYGLDFDLVLCGHAHGGQVRLPFLLPNGLWAPNQGLFPKYTQGMHDVGEGTMIVSRGLSRGPLPRVFNRPELVIVRLEDA